MFIFIHFLAAILVLFLGLINLLSEKGTPQHRMVGWFWLIMMSFVTISSFWIRDINNGGFSFLHLLSIWTIMSMGIAVISVKKGYIRMHAGFMIGTVLGSIVAGLFAMMPGRFISLYLGF